MEAIAHCESLLIFSPLMVLFGIFLTWVGARALYAKVEIQIVMDSNLKEHIGSIFSFVLWGFILFMGGAFCTAGVLFGAIVYSAN